MIYGTIISLLLVSVCTVTAVGAWASRKAGIRRNAWFGFRTSGTMRSDAAWNAAQRAGWHRRIMILPVYIAALVVSIISTVNGTFDQWAVPIVSACGIAGLLTAVWSIRAASAAARVV